MASRFWVGGTGTWDSSDTTHWAASSNGAGGQSVPTSADTVTFDGSSGGGTVTVNHATLNVQTLTTGAFTGTLDFSANNNNITITSSTGYAGSGTGTRTINLGNGTWTLSNNSATWSMSTVTGLTLNANGSTIAFTSTTPSGTRDLQTGGLTFNNVTVTGYNDGDLFSTSGAGTIASLTLGASVNWNIPQGTTITVTNLSALGTAQRPIGMQSSSIATATIAVTTAAINHAAIRFITFTGSPIAHNSFDLGTNSGVTIIPPGIRPGFALGM